MKILLSSSHFHFNPKVDENKYYHSTGLTVKVFYQALKTFGEVDIINDKDTPSGLEYDLLVSWPRNYDFLKRNNKFGKKIVFLNAPEPQYLRSALIPESYRLGCKLSDCFYFKGINDADLYFVLGGQFNRDRYVDAGVPSNKIVDAWYRTDVVPFKKRDKNKRPIFLHAATTLGLRKGFWWATQDFLKANVDAELWLMGKIQNERFWIDYTNEITKDPRVKMLGWVDYESQLQTDLYQRADFMVFPSFGEGQAGTVIEALVAGCIPLSNPESGVSFFPLGEYKRGDSSIYQRATDMTNEEFSYLQMTGQAELDLNYNNQNFIDLAIEKIKEIL
jgi:glycosyltransferase involved in cell wall biosynthesis